MPSLSRGPTSVSALAKPLSMSLPAVMQHLQVLEQAGLVARRKQGRTHFCSLQAKPLEEAERWLRQWEKFWNVRLDRLEAAIQSEKEKKDD